MNQKRCQTTTKNNQNIYVYHLKLPGNHGEVVVFIQMNVKEFKPKIHLIKF
jgi:hypothetical protein